MKSKIKYLMFLALIVAAFTANDINFREIHKVSDNKSDFFFEANDLGFLNDEKLLITDKDGFRVSICDSSLKLIKHFGERGKTIGKFKAPSQIAVNEKFIAISDFASTRIQLFNHEFTPIKELYAEAPISDIAFDSRGNLLIGTYTGNDNSLFKYTQPFKNYTIIKLKNLKGDMFKDIYKIKVLPEGKIAVMYLIQNKIELLDDDGKYLRTIIIGDIQKEPYYKKSKNNIKLPQGIILSSITCDEVSNIWILAGHYSVAPKREVFIYTKEGKKISKVVLPYEAQEIYYRNNFLYSIEEQGTVLRKYKIIGSLK